VLTEEQRAKHRWPSRTVRNATLRKLHAMPQCRPGREFTTEHRAKLRSRQSAEPQKSGRRADFAHDAIYRGERLMPVRHQGTASTTLRCTCSRRKEMRQSRVGSTVAMGGRGNGDEPRTSRSRSPPWFFGRSVGVGTLRRCVSPYQRLADRKTSCSL
jgi:hypothetical protein